MQRLVALLCMVSLAGAAHAADGTCRWTWVGEHEGCHAVRLDAVSTPLPNEGSFTITLDETGLTTQTCAEDLPEYAATDYYRFHGLACELQSSVALVHADESESIVSICDLPLPTSDLVTSIVLSGVITKEDQGGSTLYTFAVDVTYEVGTSDGCTPSNCDRLTNDCDSNGVLDSCETPDCNGNGRPDGCDLADGARDCNYDGVPDECQPDVECDVTLAVDLAWLEETKARIAANDPLVMPAYNSLISRATQALSLGPWSVTDDPENVPPSGDIRDFYQLGPYVWPDPKNPGGFIIIDGVTNPDNALDSALHWEMSNKTFWLAIAYFFTENEAYAEVAARNLRTWYVDPATAMNPNIVMQVPPYPPTMVAPGAAERLCQDLDAARILSRSPHWEPTDQAALEQWVADYIVWIDDAEEPIDERLSDNNHGIWHDVHPVLCRLFLGRVTEAHEILATIGPNRIAVQMEPDGTLPAEMVRADSLHYHEYVARALQMLADISRLSGGPDIWNYTGPDGESISLLLDFMKPYSNGAPWPFFIGSTFALQPWNHEAMYRRAALVFWDPLLEQTAAAVPDSNLPWLFNNWYAEPNVVGDATGDWRVGFDDLTAVLANWGPCPECPADITGDGSVTFADLTAVLANFEP